MNAIASNERQTASTITSVISESVFSQSLSTETIFLGGGGGGEESPNMLRHLNKRTILNFVFVFYLLSNYLNIYLKAPVSSDLFRLSLTFFLFVFLGASRCILVMLSIMFSNTALPYLDCCIENRNVTIIYLIISKAKVANHTTVSEKPMPKIF